MKIAKTKEHTQKLYIEVMKLRALTLSEEGANEINALSMIEKLFIVCQDP
tara:strand:- start:823 stop:972 length:150 start_codon:yes stop_codon:yes gene_type:complete